MKQQGKEVWSQCRPRGTSTALPGLTRMWLTTVRFEVDTALRRASIMFVTRTGRPHTRSIKTIVQ